MTTTHRIREKSTGRAYWVDRRVGFRGLEFNAGGGWRATLRDAFDAARKSNGLREVRTES